jgi:hypothetical protein
VTEDVTGIRCLRTKKPLYFSEYKGFRVCLVPVVRLDYIY